MLQVLADCSFTCDCREKIQTEFDIVFSDEEARPHVTRHTSHITRHTSHVTRHTSHVTRHTSHVTRHTSHVTRHTSHVTRHTKGEPPESNLRVS